MVVEVQDPDDETMLRRVTLTYIRSLHISLDICFISCLFSIGAFQFARGDLIYPIFFQVSEVLWWLFSLHGVVIKKKNMYEQYRFSRINLNSVADYCIGVWLKYGMYAINNL